MSSSAKKLQKLRTANTDLNRVQDNIHQVLGSMQQQLLQELASVPLVEYVDVVITANNAVGHDPIVIKTSLTNVVFISANAWNYNNPATLAVSTGVNWVPGASSELINIQGIGGLATGTRYRVRFRIEAART